MEQTKTLEETNALTDLGAVSAETRGSFGEDIEDVAPFRKNA